MKAMPRKIVERRSPRSGQDRAPTRAPGSNAAIAMLRMLWLRVPRKAERNGSSVMTPPWEGSERKRVEQGLPKEIRVSRRLNTHADQELY